MHAAVHLPPSHLAPVHILLVPPHSHPCLCPAPVHALGFGLPLPQQCSIGQEGYTLPFPPPTSLFYVQTGHNTGMSPPYLPLSTPHPCTNRGHARGFVPSPLLTPLPPLMCKQDTQTWDDTGTSPCSFHTCTSTNRGMCRRVYPLPSCAPTPIYT
jgi:hypothetical protein